MPNADQSHDTEQRKMSSALTYAQEGLFSKACHILTSSGIAPNNNTVFELLKSKHPLSDPPITPAMSTAPAIHVPPDFNISAILRSFPKATACGPSDLRVQHLIDALDATLPTSIDSLLRQVINLLITSKVPAALAPYLAGGNLTALMKLKELGWDVRPIAVGEVLRRLAGKSCPGGTEKIIHRLRQTVEDHWHDSDFAILKIDMQNAFNLVSRDTALKQCAIHFPELLPWVSWCYSQHQYLWRPMGKLISASGVQQGDPLGPLLFALVLNDTVTKIAQDPLCGSLQSNFWYLDDGVLSGPRLAHLARSIPPTTASLEAFAKFDDDVLHCLECSVEIELTPRASYIASLSMSLTPIQPSELTMQRLCDAIMVFNGKVACCEQLSVEDVLATSQHQHKLSSAIEKAGFLSLLDGASTVDKARLLAISAPQAHAWLRAQPSPKLGLDLLPNEAQALVKWWLGLPVFTDADACLHCSQTLDIHGHHALICHAGGDVVTRHNRLRDSFADFCRRAYLAPELERGCGLTSTKDRTRPADVLVPNWSLSRSAAFDLKVINPLNSNFLLGASMTSGYTAELGEKDKYPKMTFPVQREVGSVSHWS
eukprot:Em0010g906a